MLLVPLDRPPQSILKRRPGHEAEALAGPGRVQPAARLAVRLRGVPDDLAPVARQLGDQVDEVLDQDLVAGAVVDRLRPVVALGGQDDPEEILKSVKHGLYAVTFGGGQVDITNGKFVFSASEAYLVEDGRITAPVKGATLIGNGPEALTRVTRVGNDLKLDEGVGTCGKDGQSVPVGVGLPTIRIDGITVGGTAV